MQEHGVHENTIEGENLKPEHTLSERWETLLARIVVHPQWKSMERVFF
jgi:hypothetical protein